MMNEKVVATFLFNKTVALLDVEPLNFSFWHDDVPSYSSALPERVIVIAGRWKSDPKASCLSLAMSLLCLFTRKSKPLVNLSPG